MGFPNGFSKPPADMGFPNPTSSSYHSATTCHHINQFNQFLSDSHRDWKVGDMMISDSDQIYLAVYVLCIVGILCILLHLLYMLNKEKIKIYIFSKSWGKKIFCSEEEKLDENKPFMLSSPTPTMMQILWRRFSCLAWNLTPRRCSTSA